MSEPSTPKAAATGIADLTPREQEILSKAWGCLKSGPPEIDYEKLANELGMTNFRSASNAWGAIKKKMGTTWGATGTPGSAKSVGGKRKKNATDKVPKNGSDSAGEEDPETPAPAAKKARASRVPRVTNLPRTARKKVVKSAPAPKEEDDAEGDNGETSGVPAAVATKAVVKDESDDAVNTSADPDCHIYEEEGF